MANRPYPKLAYKFYGPYTILEKIGKVAYRLDLPQSSQIHLVFHISQLKSFVPDFSPVFSELPVTTDIEAATAVPEVIIERRLVKKGATAVPQVLVKWSGLPMTSATWEDYNVLRHRFPDAPAWGQAGPSRGGDVSNRATAATSLKEIMIDDGQPEDDEHIQAKLGPHRGRCEIRPNNCVHGPE